MQIEELDTLAPVNFDLNRYIWSLRRLLPAREALTTMSYIDNNLLGGESIIYRTRLHWKVYLVPLFVVLVVFVPLAVWALATDRKPLALIPFSAALVLLTGAHLYRVSSQFAVTNKRVIVKVGMLSTRSIELLLPKIEALAVSQSLMGRMLGYGEIVVTGSGGTRETFSSIQSPLKFRQAVQAATEGVTTNASPTST